MKDKPSAPPIVLAAILVPAAVFVLVKMFWPQPSLEDMARRASDCWARADSRCVASFISKSELSALGTTREKAETALRDHLLVPFRQATKLGSPKVDSSFESQRATAQQGLRLSNGRIVEAATTVQVMDDGVRIPSLLSHAVLLGSEARRPLSDTTKQGRLRAFLRTAQEEGPQLEAMGIPGLVRYGKLTTWKEFEVEQTTRIARYEASLRSGKG